MEAASQYKTQDFYQKLIDREARVIVLHTSNLELALDQFNRFSRRSGQSLYQWSDGAGLQSLKDSHIVVPATRKLSDTLRYVLKSKHYGVYLLTHFGAQLRGRCEDFLLQIQRSDFGDARKVILIGENLRLPRRISTHVEHVTENDPGEFRLRLRNGRWVA